MNKLTILTDVDGVLLNFVKGFAEFLKSKSLFKEELDSEIQGNKYFDLKDLIILDCPIECESLINEFYSSEYVGQLKEQQEGLRNIIKSLSNEFNLICITCIGTSDHLKEQRRINLINVFGDHFEEIHCINLNDSKEEFIFDLSKRYNVFTYIDDRLKHINESINAGIKPILFTQGHKHTENSDDFHIMDCWHQIHDFIKLNAKSIENKSIC